MKRRFLPALLLLALGACAAPGEPPISDLAAVLARPLDYDGRRFEGYVYLDVAPNYYAFWPTPPGDGRAVQQSDIILMPGSGEELYGHEPVWKQGQRLYIRATIRPQRGCFGPQPCVPFLRPVFFDDLKILEPR